MEKTEEIDKDIKETTFVIPMKNSGQTIEKCLRSIVAAREENQDYGIRIIVVDDASQDDSTEKVMNFRAENENIDVQLIRNKLTMGRAATRNIGLNQVKTPYVAFVDSDLQLPLLWLQTCIKQLQEDKRVACVSASVQPDGYLSHFAELFGLKNVQKRPTNNMHGSNMLCNTGVIRELGGFDVNMPDGEDTDLGYRLLRKGFKINFIDDLVSSHHVQPSLKSLMQRSFSHGRAGTLLFMKYRKLKIQDFAFLAFLALLFICILFCFIPEWFIWVLVSALLLLFIGSTLFSISNFDLIKKVHLLPLLILISSVFLIVYFIGRFAGVFTSISQPRSQMK